MAQNFARQSSKVLVNDTLNTSIRHPDSLPQSIMIVDSGVTCRKGIITKQEVIIPLAERRAKWKNPFAASLAVIRVFFGSGKTFTTFLADNAPPSTVNPLLQLSVLLEINQI